jgi:hypothetical protein
MKTATHRLLPWAALACFGALSLAGRAQGRINPPDQAPQVAIAQGRYAANYDDDVVTIGGNSMLAQGKSADAVVSFFGSSTIKGNVADSVVAVLGSSRITGPVGDSVVAVASEAYVNSKIHGDVVAVLGNVVLGPAADISGRVIAIGGVIKRDPAAMIHGNVQGGPVGTIPQGWLYVGATLAALLYGTLLGLGAVDDRVPYAGSASRGLPQR